MPAVIEGQLALDCHTFEALEVAVQVIDGYGRKIVKLDPPKHTHAPRRPPAIKTDPTWLRILAYTEEQIRWACLRAVLDLSKKPDHEITGGICGKGYHLEIDSKGCRIPRTEQQATWPQLLRGLATQRDVEPAIARARDLADAYHTLDYYGDVYSGKDFLGRDQAAHGSWRADRFIVAIAEEVIDLGGDPTLLPIHSEYMRVGIDVALGRLPAPWEDGK